MVRQQEEPAPTAVQHQFPIETEPTECHTNHTDGNSQEQAINLTGAQDQGGKSILLDIVFHCVHKLVAPGGQTPTLHSQLEPGHKRPMGTEHGAGIPTGIRIKPGPKGSSPSTTAQPTGDRSHPGGSGETGPKRSHSTSGTISTPVFEPDFCGPKERRNLQANYKSESAEQIRKAPAFQDGRASAVQGSPAERGLDGNDRSQGCIPININCSRPLEPTEVQVAGSDIRLRCLPFGLSSAPRVFTKLLNPILALIRQRGFRIIVYLDDMMLMARSPQVLMSQLRALLQILQLLGFMINWKKSSLKPTQEIQFLGLEVNSVNMKLALPEGKVRALTKKMSSGTSASVNDSINSGSSPCTPALPQFAKTEERSLRPHPLVRDSGAPGRNSERRASVVVPTFSRMEREANSNARSSHDHQNRCISSGLGSVLCRYSDRRTLVGRGTQDAYQLPGATGRSICRNSVWENKPEHAYSSSNGQHNSHILYQQDGGRPFIHTSKVGLRPMAMVPEKRNYTVSGTYARNTECDSRHGIPHLPLVSRVAAVRGSFRGIMRQLGSVRWTLSHTTKPSTSPVHKLEAGSSRHGYGRIPSLLDGPNRLCLPTFRAGRQMPAESETGTEHFGPDRTSVALTGERGAVLVVYTFYILCHVYYTSALSILYSSSDVYF